GGRGLEEAHRDGAAIPSMERMHDRAVGADGHGVLVLDHGDRDTFLRVARAIAERERSTGADNRRVHVHEAVRGHRNLDCCGGEKGQSGADPAVSGDLTDPGAECARMWWAMGRSGDG